MNSSMIAKFIVLKNFPLHGITNGKFESIWYTINDTVINSIQSLISIMKMKFNNPLV